MVFRSYSFLIMLGIVLGVCAPTNAIGLATPAHVLRITLNADQQVRSWCIPSISDPHSTFAHALRNPTIASLTSLMQSNGARQCRTAPSERQALFNQPTAPHQAALVIDFGDGRVQTFCIEIANPDSTTGEEILRASNLPIVAEYNPGVGVAVCKISDIGTNFPNEPCFAQCTLRPNEPCNYWTYMRMVDGAWIYSQLGASNVTVQPGDVEGWTWGDSNVGQNTTLPLFRFSDICTGAQPTPSPTATATPTVPTPTRRPTKVPQPTDTPENTHEPATATPTPVATATARATTTNTPNATPMPPSATPRTLTLTPLLSVTTPHAVAVEPTAPPTITPTSLATSTSEPPTPVPTATPTEQPASEAIAHVDQPTIAAPTAMQAVNIHLPWIEEAASGNAETVLAAVVAPTAAPLAPEPSAATHTPAPHPLGQVRSSYLGFALLVIALQLVWVWVRRKRGAP